MARLCIYSPWHSWWFWWTTAWGASAPHGHQSATSSRFHQPAHQPGLSGPLGPNSPAPNETHTFVLILFQRSVSKDLWANYRHSQCVSVHWCLGGVKVMALRGGSCWKHSTQDLKCCLAGESSFPLFFWGGRNYEITLPGSDFSHQSHITHLQLIHICDERNDKATLTRLMQAHSISHKHASTHRPVWTSHQGQKESQETSLDGIQKKNWIFIFQTVVPYVLVGRFCPMFPPHSLN